MKKKNKIKFRFNFNKLLLLVIPIIFLTGSVAKYVKEKNTELVYEAKNFYFESDLLSNNTKALAYTYDVGNDEITINLKNNIDELRYSDVDIKYTVSLTDMQGNEVKDRNGDIVEDINGKLSNNSIDSKKITFENLSEGKYIVIAKAIEPYEKTLQASFTLKSKNESIEYKVSDSVNSPVLQLTVKTTDYKGNVKITWPSNVVPDNTESKFVNVNSGYNGGNIDIPFETNSEYIFQFFKKQPSICYDKSSFMVERSE